MPLDQSGDIGRSSAPRKDDPEAKTVGNRAHARYEGPIAPVAASIIAFIGWAIFILVYALYWSPNFSLFQNFVVTIVSLIITGLLVGLMWVLLGPKGSWRG